MATVDVPRSKKRGSPHPQAEPAPLRKKKSHAFRNGCIVTFLLLCLTLYFAPTILGSTPLGPWVLQSVLKLDGTLSFDSVSLGWFSSVSAEKIEIRDTDGNPVVEVGEVSTDKSLIAILLDFSDVGLVHVANPMVHVVADDKQTNLERVFAPLLTDVGGPRQVAARLDLADGTIFVDDVPAGRKFRIEKLHVVCAIGYADEPLALTASGTTTDERQPGSFQVDLHTKGSAAAETALASGKVDCQTSALPLELLDPLLRRVAAGATLSGRLSTKLGGAWGEMAEGGDASIRGDALVTALDFTATALGQDHVRINRIEMPCHIIQSGELVEIEQAGLTCDLGQLTLTGRAKMSDFSAADKLAALLREDYQLKGHLDLTQLARLLPETLRIREGTEITSGQIDLVVAGRQQASGMTWTGNIEASQLGAQAEGRSLVWSNPLSIECAAHESTGGLVVDKATCSSSFLQASAAGSIDDLTASADFDLARLLQELRQFSNFDNVQVAGRGQAQLAWKRGADDKFTAQGDFQARGFRLVGPSGQVWTEDDLIGRLDADGQLKDHSVARVDHVELTVDTGGERLQARLQEPVSDFAGAVWPIQCSWRGPMAHWTPRLQSWLGVAGLDLGGAGSVQAALGCSSKAIAIEQAKVDVVQLRVWGDGLFVSEPSLTATTAGRCDLAKMRVEVGPSKLTAGGTVATLDGATLQSTAGTWTVEGCTAHLVADLAQLYRWQHDPRVPAAVQVAGRLSGNAELKYDAGTTSARLDGTIDQLQVADLARPANAAAPSVWREARIALAAAGDYRTSTQQIRLDKLQIASNALQCDAKGSLPLSAQGGDVDLKGTYAYDWEQLTPLLRPYVGEGVQVAGRQTREFSVHGHLTGMPTSADAWRQVAGEAAIGWTAMNVHGMQVGAGEIAALLANGQVQTKPIDVPVSEGRFTFVPVVRLSPGPAEMFLSSGPLLTNVHLSPELCAKGLKYVTPVLAEATVAEGVFSVVMDGGRVPLNDPTNGDLSGKMAMRAQAKAGPLAQEFMVLIDELTTILQRGALARITDQSGAVLSVDTGEIEFRMVNRRVYHRGLKFTAGAVEITTHGSVGFDNSLAIVAEIPLQATLFGQDLSFGALEGQTLQIPISGTLGKPQLDRSVLTQLPAKILQGAARGVLLDGVGKQLERLLPPRP